MRKPSAAPAVMAAKTAAWLRLRSKAMIEKVIALIAQTPGGQPVGAVGQVDDVHHRDEAGDGERAARVAEVDRAHEGQRDVGDLDARRDRDARPPRSGPASLTPGGRSKRSSRAPTKRDDHRAGQDPLQPIRAWRPPKSRKSGRARRARRRASPARRAAASTRRRARAPWAGRPRRRAAPAWPSAASAAPPRRRRRGRRRPRRPRSSTEEPTARGGWATPPRPASRGARRAGSGRRWP